MLLRLMLLGALAASGVGASSAHAQPNYVSQARLAYAAIICEKYAETASYFVGERRDDSDDSGRLFALGYRALQTVFEARHRGVSMRQESLAKELYYEFILNVRLGPTAEFDVGHTHRSITEIAWARIHDGIPNDVAVASADYLIQAKAAAQRLYREANCDFVGR